MSIYKNWFYMIKNKGDSVVVGTVGKSKLLDFTNKSKLRRNPNFPL